MKQCIILFCILLISSCRTTSPTIEREVVTKDSVIVVERLVPIVHPADSASILALLKCDENGRILLSYLETANSKNVELQFQLDSLGVLKANFKLPSDTIYLPSKTSKTVQSQNNKEKVVVEVEKELNEFQRFCIIFTIVISVMMLIKLFLFIRKKFF